MASNSIIAAVMEKFDSFTASLFPGESRPPIAFDEMPQYDGGQLRTTTGYIIVKDGGLQSQHTFESDPIEAGPVIFEVYADTLAHVDQCVNAIRWNGQTPRTRAGFDFGTLILNSPRSHMQMVHRSEQRAMVGIGHTGQRVHYCAVTYDVQYVVLGGATP